jgi:magnesium transporter
MHACYDLTDTGPRPQGSGQRHVSDSIWIDLLNPTAEDDAEAEAFLGVSIPTREEAAEIETSSRFYTEDGATFLNLSTLVGIDRRRPTLSPLTYVLAGSKVATVRYEDSVAFRQFLAKATKPKAGRITAPGIVIHLTESIIDRAADVIEKVGAEIDRINNEVFKRDERKPNGAAGLARKRELSEYLEAISYQNDIISKSREALLSIERMIQYVSGAEIGWHEPKADRERLQLMALDVRSLTDQLSFLSSRATFLLEATLGLISVDQNDVIRVLTVAATILLPPTLIGTIYGMNFASMPELDWSFGYPLAIGLMIGAALIPYLILKRRGWF